MKKTAILLFATAMLFLFASASAELVRDHDYTVIPWNVKSSPNMPAEEAYLPDDAGYSDDSIDVRIDTFRAYDTTVMRVRVKLTDVCQFRTSLANNYPSKAPRHVSDMTKRANAVLGINGDYFIYHSQGIVYRNGKRLRFSPHKGRDTLVLDEWGNLHILPKTSKADWEAYLEGGGTVIHAWCFGPGLVIDGVPLTDLDTVTLDCGKAKETQRIAIGQTGPLEYMILATEGPENEGSTGVDLLEMAQLCVDNGMINAYNLDGGSSSTVSLRNNKINSVSSHKIRLVGDCIWFATLVPNEEDTVH
ncbi:MAG: phosphodiester glycosidase family protein [Clostridia bacterium]|nr:phosphodiester glycosidase family protein [Clostridia bacterium]